MMRTFFIVPILFALAVTGCTPSRPFYLHERQELAHYVDSALKPEYADVYHPRLDEVDKAQAPITLSNPEFIESWELSLQEAIHTGLQNSKVIRNLGSVTPFGFADGLTGRTVGSTTIYDPAIFETDPQSGIEAALSNFDAVFTSSVFWQKTDRPQNVNATSFGFIPFFFQQDQGQFEAAISKLTMAGTRFTLRNNTTYDRNNRGFGRALPSDWYTAMEIEMNQPLVRGNGTQINRIPLLLARINSDVSLAQFEVSVRNLVMDIENTYWDLYTAYRNLEASKIARDSAQATWKIAFEKFKGKVETAQAEAQSQEQYFFFHAQVETAWRDLLNVETRLRWLMGLTTSDGRIVRPADEPVQARVEFDWQEIHEEALMRSTELRQQKWAIKRRELELIAARHQLLPEVNLVALYRWLGLGDDLVAANRRGINFVSPGSMAWDEMTEGNFQEVRLGLDFRPPPIGARREMAGVRNAQLQIARERARLEDMELNTTHLLTTAIRNLDYNRRQAQTHFNRWATAQKEVESATALYRGGKAIMDLVLEAQRRRAQAQSDYYRALGEHTKSISDVHFRKGTLLSYNDIHLAEGPWPEKAYQDARERSRARSAGRYMDFGWIRPGYISRGPVNLEPPAEGQLNEEQADAAEAEPTPLEIPEEVQPAEEPPGTQADQQGLLPVQGDVELEGVNQELYPLIPSGPHLEEQ
jgi:outer membrane protein TolC